MSLSGNLGFVSLDEVLRLLTRSNQQGAVDVSSDEVRGRIFVTKGGVALATTSDDTGMHRHLVKSGLVDESFLESVEAGETTLAPIVEKSGGALTDLLREMTVESIYQLGLKGDAFEVFEGQETVYANPGAFELEDILEDSKQRLNDWAEVSKTVRDLHDVMRFSRDLGDRDEVNIDRDSWRVLSEIGSGSSVSTIADELGTTDFWAARIAARLIDTELLTPDEEEVVGEAAQPEPVESSWDSQVRDEEADAGEPVDADESWWEEPADEDSDEAAAELSEEPEAAEVLQSEEAEEVEEQVSTSIFGAYKPSATDETAETPEGESSQIPTLTETADSAEVEEDTEAFLEKVFSELETGEDETEEEGEGYGLLRRRRMGAIRDSSGDA